MSENIDNTSLDVATLPLADGRQVVLPLLTLAEVQQIKPEGETLGVLLWRGHELPITSLEAFCGLTSSAPENYNTVGIFRADREEETPFRAMAFCGLAAYRQVRSMELKPIDQPAEGNFIAAVEIDGNSFLVPDIAGELYGQTGHALH